MRELPRGDQQRRRADTDGGAAAHEHTLAKIFPRIAETGVAKDVLTALAAAS
ncbi:hypothetical protein [Amycolatopsis kentuckyensis]|uniref:hypothetical protein n=1 Tax=Amycolatopsis kentuckyensis TaxID=218823 RepID=UPI003564EE41